MRVVIKIDEVETYGWQAAIRGMRNPKNSWEKSDSYPAVDCGKCGVIDRDGICHPKEHDCTPFACYAVGDNDLKLMETLGAAGTDHGKYLRMITVTADITAPLYWWKEYDTYKVGTVANSCSTMHKIQAKEFVLSDFSTEHLKALEGKNEEYAVWFGGTETASSPTPTGSEGKFKFAGELSVYVTGGGVNEVRGMAITIAPSTPITEGEE